MEPISLESILTLFIMVVFGFGLPIAATILWKRYSHTSIKPMLVGAAVFVIFAMIIEQAVHAVCILFDNPISKFVTSNGMIYAIYGGLAAGLCEEIGRFVAFKFVLKKEKHPDSAIMYGIGHGGIECIFVLGVTVLVYLILALMYNSMGYENFIIRMGADLQQEWNGIIASLSEYHVMTGAAGVVERVAAIALHVELSVIVFAAVKQNKIMYLPLAIVLHALIDVIAGLYQVGWIDNIWLIEGIIILYVGAIFFFADKKYEELKKDA
ncbi:MAG: YhfC family intramembrane metalloprotease [Lachnospiraceae bacterium]